MAFHPAQESFGWNPSRLLTPAEWVTIRRLRAKDAVNSVWWLSPTPWFRADNRRVLQPYSQSMRDLLKNGYKAMKRPSGHDISEKFSRNNGAAIPPNLISLAHTESNSYYLRYCKQHAIEPHPARFPAEIPEYFVRMLTDPGDLVVDPFAGSCVTGEVCEGLDRRWVCVELVEEYLKAALARFKRSRPAAQEELFPEEDQQLSVGEEDNSDYYRVPRPGLLWNGCTGKPLAQDGGRQRRVSASRRAEAIARHQAT